MSQSSLKMTARFVNPDTVESVAALLLAARDAILAAYSGGEEMYLHDYLAREQQTSGISFDSFWMVEAVSIRDRYWLTVELTGSPSGTDEQDFISWLRGFGVTGYEGELVLDGGGDVTVEQLLYEPGVQNIAEDDLHVRDGAGHTPMHLAAEAGNAQKVQALIDLGADTEALNRAKGTPLFMAINTDISTAKAIACIDVLLDAGANINARSETLGTPVEWARRRKLNTIVAHLEERGAAD